MSHIVESLLFHKRSRFLTSIVSVSLVFTARQKTGLFTFTTNAASAKAQNCFLFVGLWIDEQLSIVREPLRKVAKLHGVWIDGVLETADVHLKIVATIDDGDRRISQQRVPLRRFDVLADERHVDIFDAHRHDFLAQVAFESTKGIHI